jgi:Tol biopolymer transport system component
MRNTRRLFAAAIVAALVLPDSSNAQRATELPLKPARTVKFTTDEGTWMSVDLSPDGKTLVFDLTGDLYTLPIAGGKATRITDGLPFDVQPRWSPDGKNIVYVTGRRQERPTDHEDRPHAISLAGVYARRQVHRRLA